MSGSDTPLEERKVSAAFLAERLYQSVKCRFPRNWHETDLNADAIDERRSASLLEFGFTEWPKHYRISIHSDPRGSLLGYGVFRPARMDLSFTHEQLAKHLAARVPDRDKTTRVLWAWYRKVDEPLRDFSQQETLIETETIRTGQKSKGYDAFRRVSDRLAELSEALDDWYSEVGRTRR